MSDTDKFMRLYHTTNEIIGVLGCHGIIRARDDRVQAVMDALYAIDGGTYIKPPESPADVEGTA